MTNWTEEQLAQHQAKRKGVMPSARTSDLESGAIARGDASAQTNHTSKYRNVKCEYQGEHFDSKHELDDWLVLKARQELGEISDLQRQVNFPLYCQIRFRDTTLGSTQVCSYIADFVYVENGQRIVQDSKGHRTREYLLKRKWLERQEGIDIRET